MPDVPKDVKDKIARERFIDQRERWTNAIDEQLTTRTTRFQRVADSDDVSKNNHQSPIQVNVESPLVQQKRRRNVIRTKVMPVEPQ